MSVLDIILWMWSHNVIVTVQGYFGKMYAWVKGQQLKLLKSLIGKDYTLVRIFLFSLLGNVPKHRIKSWNTSLKISVAYLA